MTPDERLWMEHTGRAAAKVAMFLPYGFEVREVKVGTARVKTPVMYPCGGYIDVYVEFGVWGWPILSSLPQPYSRITRVWDAGETWRWLRDTGRNFDNMLLPIASETDSLLSVELDGNKSLVAQAGEIVEPDWRYEVLDLVVRVALACHAFSNRAIGESRK